MFVHTARFVAKEGMVSDVIRIARKCADETRKEPGCISYELLASVEREREFVFLEIWEDESALKAHHHAEHVKRYMEEKVKYVEGPSDLLLFDATRMDLT
jgi:quinol monooxygenase YgiN